jgi:nucleotide-binding universal stress UspA family protein
MPPSRKRPAFEARWRRIEVIETAASHWVIQPTILSSAADASLDMLVIGAFGQSRLQETVFGGGAREMLRTIAVPTLMSR